MESIPTPRVMWITGWGMPLDWWRPTAEVLLPKAEHSFGGPEKKSVAMSKSADLVIGWSLGALYLIEELASGGRWEGKIILLAPFLAFCAEHGCGGKCATTHVKWLSRWVERKRVEALNDFHKRANITGVEIEKAPGTKELLQGLDRLGQDATPAMRQWAKCRLQKNVTLLVGERDELLHADQVAESLPGTRIVKGAGHSAIELLEACPEVLRAV